VRWSEPRRAAAVLAAVLLGLGVSPAVADELEILTEQREELEGNLDAITAELEAISVRLADVRAERIRLERDVDALQSQAEDAEALLAGRAVAAYVNRGNDPVGLLLSSRQTTQALERSRLLDGMGRREQALIEHATAARLAFRQQRASLDSLIAELEEGEHRLSELRAELDEAFREAYRRERAVVSRRDRQRRVSRSGMDGVYACPMASPYHFRDTWGAPRSGGRRHRGVDIFGQLGADIYAITDGVVVRHSRSRLGGIGLYLMGDDGNQYYYAHLKEILPEYRPGTRVEAGALIASNGYTGNASIHAPHLHMEVRPGGGPNVNPYSYAAAACW
jgi:peptidoglycan LD-endopeptidase LytH